MMKTKKIKKTTSLCFHFYWTS